MTLQQQIMEARTKAGLRLEFIISGRGDTFVCYPKDEAQKAEWLRNAERKGWKVA